MNFLSWRFNSKPDSEHFFAFENSLDPVQTRQNISSGLHLSWLPEMFWKLLIERKNCSKLPSKHTVRLNILCYNPIPHRPRIPRIATNGQIFGFVSESYSVREDLT